MDDVADERADSWLILVSGWTGAGFRGRDTYRPVAKPKVVLDAVDAIDDNLDLVRRNLLGGARS